MPNYNIILPSKPRIVSENETTGIYEIDGLYPGYGHTLGNSLRRIILSSLPGAAITSVKIDGVSHEFSTMNGVKQDVIAILLNLKKVRLQMLVDEPQIITLSVKGIKSVTASDIKVPGQVEILNPDQPIADVTDKQASLEIEMKIEKGLGYIPREVLQEGKVEVGAIALDAAFSPIKRVSYEVENMRVGDRTDYNRLRISIQTDGTLSAKEALERSIEIMISQLKAIIGFKEEESVIEEAEVLSEDVSEEAPKSKEVVDPEFLKTRIEQVNFSKRTMNALVGANIRTIGGLARKKEEDLKDIEGLGNKGIEEIKEILAESGVSLK